MKIYAIYRMYYGEDFIEASIMSIYNHVDKIFVFISENAFGNVHKGRVDDSLHVVMDIVDPDNKIVAIPNVRNCESPINQFTNLYNTNIYMVWPKPDAIMCIEHDMVWHSDELEAYLITLSTLDRGSYLEASQIEFWHNIDWMLPWRYRKTIITHKLAGGGRMPDTDHSGYPVGQRRGVVTSARTIYNFGFCMSPENMKIKCKLGIKYSVFIKDSIPNPDWYHNKWLTWHPIHNNKNLEISKGYEHHIPRAIKAQLYPLPESLKNHKWNPSIFTQAQELSSGDIQTK